MLTDEQRERGLTLLDELVAAHAAAALCADELRTLLRGVLPVPDRPVGATRLFVDPSTFTVTWGDKPCPLGDTHTFRLIQRLSRRPNRYVTHDQLLDDVWDGEVRSPDTVRSVVRHLKGKLRAAGLGELATAVRAQRHRYALVLSSIP